MKGANLKWSILGGGWLAEMVSSAMHMAVNNKPLMTKHINYYLFKSSNNSFKRFK
jgi:hypothetical protein